MTMTIAPQRIRDLVIQDMMARSELAGLSSDYRNVVIVSADVLNSSYQKALDLCIYLRAEMERREAVCPRCDGCGLVADTDEGEPWTAWTSLPIESQAPIKLGMVHPMPCTGCNGIGLL